MHRGQLIPFPARSVREAAAYALALTARWQRLSKRKPWLRSHPQPERLGNMLQILITKRPTVVYVLESIVAEMLRQIDP